MELTCHPQSPRAEVRSIEVAVWRDGDRWHFRYLVEGADELVLPDAAEPGRSDGLWKTTCFEAFVGLAGDSYVEFNFSSSGQWAAYRFDAHRSGMREEAAQVEAWLEGGDGWIAVEATVECAALDDDAPLNLTAVIEEPGRSSYWALAHPAGPPDFHDRACFVGTLADIGAS